MPFQRATSPADLYDAVADHDLVVVPDAPLAAALNRRLTEPHLGPFAITPRRLAAGRREEAEDRLAFLAVLQRTDVDWKRCAHAVGNILQCWEHQGAVDAILEDPDYAPYVDETTRIAVDAIRDLDTTSRALADYRIGPDRDVAVVAEDQLTTLERSILPDSFTAVDPFADEETFDLPPFHVYDSATGVVDAVLDAVDGETAEDVAVVLDAGSTYSTVLEAGLEDAGVPFYGGPGFADEPANRAFVQFLRALHAGTDVRVEAVRPVLDALGIDLPVAYDTRRLRELPLDDLAGGTATADRHSEADSRATLRWLLDRCAEPAARTAEETLDAFAARSRYDEAALEGFRDELATLGVADAPLTQSLVDRLAFYLDTYEVPLTRENEGVLLADATSAAYVDRPLVFYLGLDESWTQRPPRRPWVDEDAVHDRYRRQFEQLLQSGTDRYYLVQDAAGGQPVTPCLYFEELLDGSVERFTDLPAERHHRTYGRGGSGFAGPVDGEPTAAEDTTLEPADVDVLSQSSLNRYVNSPRDYLFDRLLDGPDRDYFREGSLFHDFAELYVEHPGVVAGGEGDEGVLDAVVDYMVSEVRPLVRSVDERVRRTRYRAGCETLMTYLDRQRPFESTFLTPASDWPDNELAEQFGLSVTSDATERWFENHPLGLKGLIDLVAGPTELVDYKSGARKSARDVVSASAVDPPADTPNFQAAAYLAHWRSRRPDERLTFTFVHFLECLDQHVAGDGDVDLADAVTTVTYYPTTFRAHAASQECFEALVADGAKNCQKTFEQVDYADYRAVFLGNELPDARTKDALLDSAFADALVAAMQREVGEYTYVESGCAQALRQLARIDARNFFAPDLDAVEAFVDDTLAELNRRRRGEERFPVDGPGGEPNYRRVDHRDLLLEGGTGREGGR